MKLNITRQESYSRGELLLRTLLGVFYIVLPHFIVLIFLSIWSGILQFISWWVILFTGRYPQSFFEFQVKLMRWGLRVNARLLNLADGYPAFGLDTEDELVELEVEYPESLSRGTLLLKSFFGVLYVMLPHGIILWFRTIWGAILNFLAFWVVLFTGSYPESWHTFQVETLRWQTRVNLYMGYMTDEYPPFSGKE